MFERIKYFIRRNLLFYGLISVKKNTNSIKWGIIGLGSMAEKFALTVAGSKDGIIYAVSSRSLDKANKFARRYGKCKAYGSYSDMLTDTASNLDIIYIATPLTSHYEIIKQCLLANKNVLCEKPMTSNATQFEELMVIAKRQNCFLMEGMWMKCLPTFRKAVEWINEDKIGIVELVRADFYKREIIKTDLTIYNSIEGGGLLQDFGSYAIAFMTFFLKGVPTSLEYANRTSSFNLDSDWHIIAHNNGVKAFISLSSNFSSLSKAAIIGKQGSIEWSSQFNRTNKISLFDAHGKKTEEFVCDYKYEGLEYQVEEVTRCLKSKEIASKIVPLLETLDALKVMDQLMYKRSVNNIDNELC